MYLNEKFLVIGQKNIVYFYCFQTKDLISNQYVGGWGSHTSLLSVLSYVDTVGVPGKKVYAL